MVKPPVDASSDLDSGARLKDIPVALAGSSKGASGMKVRP
jgi:hypothetical protein